MPASDSPDKLFEKPTKIRAGAWVWDKDLECLVPKYGRNYHEIDEKRSDLPAPMVNSGRYLKGRVKSMVDGKYYDTARNYEKSVARAGCDVVGFDKRWEEQVKAPQPYDGEKAHEASVVQDVKKAIEIENGKLPPAGGLADRRLARKQRRNRKGI